jgi:hypothetical protein
MSLAFKMDQSVIKRTQESRNLEMTLLRDRFRSSKLKEITRSYLRTLPKDNKLIPHRPSKIVRSRENLTISRI